MKFLSSPFVMPVGIIIYSIVMCCYSPPPVPEGDDTVQEKIVQSQEIDNADQQMLTDSLLLTNYTAVGVDTGDAHGQLVVLR